MHTVWLQTALLGFNPGRQRDFSPNRHVQTGYGTHSWSVDIRSKMSRVSGRPFTVM